MVNKPKIQGTKFETETVNKLNNYGFKSKRLAEAGINDEGDIECFNEFSNKIPKPRIVLEAKHRQALNVHQTMAKAKEKAGDSDVILAWKKTIKKNNSRVRVADGERIVYIVDEDLLFRLLENYDG
jgi:Holliday junction resolvase